MYLTIKNLYFMSSEDTFVIRYFGLTFFFMNANFKSCSAFCFKMLYLTEKNLITQLITKFNNFMSLYSLYLNSVHKMNIRYITHVLRVLFYALWLLWTLLTKVLSASLQKMGIRTWKTINMYDTFCAREDAELYVRNLVIMIFWLYLVFIETYTYLPILNQKWNTNNDH